MSFDSSVVTVEHSPLLEWRRTEVSGRVASYGVGRTGPAIVLLHGRRATTEHPRARYERPAAVAVGSADQGVAGGKIPIPVPIPSTS